MKSFLSISRAINKGEVTGHIRLGGFYETFNLNTIDWSIDEYIMQWKHAIALAIDDCQTVCLIKNYEHSNDQVKRIELYTVIPKDNACPNGLYKDKPVESDFFITESFIFVTQNMLLISQKKSFEDVRKSFGNYFPIYYIDENNLDLFYLYLSDKIDGISCWGVSEDDLKSVLMLT